MRSSGLSVGIEQVWRRYGSVTAVAGVSLHVEAGAFVSLLGPSGSGKTTLLMMLAGFEQPDAGRLTVGDRDLTRVPPNKRGIAMVFQRYALFPHMTVAENIAFPLRTRGMGRAEREDRIRRALSMVKLDEYAARKPAELSGGQQQRVALARAIVFEPPVILMDEPLGALDKKLRGHMQVELKQLQRRLGATVIYVTHDQEEALTMSDQVAVMDKGRLVQLGSPRELYDRPADAFVADFIGEMNLLPGTAGAALGTSCEVALEGGSAAGRAHAPLPQGAAIRLAVRPEHVTLSASTQGAQGAQGAQGLRGRLVQLVFNGASTAMLVELPGGTILRADIGTRSAMADLEPGAEVVATWHADEAIVFPAGPK
jgi:spermidine/putrescine ABC transporter ATP-binding subunit